MLYHRRVLAIAKLDLKSTFRNKSSLFFGFLFPLIFIFIFGSLGQDGITYRMAIIPGTDVDNPVYETLQDISVFEFQEIETEEEITTMLGKGQLDGGVFIAKNEDPTLTPFNVKVYTSAVNPESSSVVLNIIGSIVDEVNKASLPADAVVIVSLETEAIAGREFKQIDFILPGQLAFALMSIGVIGTAFLLVNLRETLVLKRFTATPLKGSEVILGFGLSKLFYAMLQASILIIAGVLLFEFTLVNGFTTFVEMIIFSLFGLVVFLGFGFIVSSLAKDESAVAPLSNIITLPQFLLAGTFFPIEFFPEWLQPISRILPLTYLNTALRKISFEGASFLDLGTEIAALLIWGVIVYIVAVKLFNRKGA